MEATIRQLQRRVTLLSCACGILAIGMALFLFLAWSPPPDAGNVTRTRGIIVTDEQGRDRILIGAPLPDSPGRIRADFDKAKAAWGNRYPSFDWYKKLENGSTGIVILDEKGYDRVILGAPVPDPNIGKRVGPSFGMAINDTEGFERSGYGYFPENNRVVLGLDSPRGTEGAVLCLLEDGSTGLSVTNGRRSLFLGSAPAGGMLTELPGEFHGLLMKDSARVTHAWNAMEKK